MTHDVVVLPFKKMSRTSAVSGGRSTSCGLEIAPYSSAAADAITSSTAHFDMNAMSVAIALRYLSGRLRVSVRTKR